MIVSELIEALAQMPHDARVVTGGFDEAGVDDVAPPQIMRVRFDVHSEGAHVGPHERRGDGIDAVWIDW